MSQPARHVLSESQKRMYAHEKEENFRWIARLLRAPAPASQLTLTPAQRAPPALQQHLSELGQFAELANGLVDAPFVWRAPHLEVLTRGGFPLAGYDALRGSRLVGALRGRVAQQHGCVVHRPRARQLVVAFSGTVSVAQALHDMDFRLVAPHALRAAAAATGYAGPPARVHAGFWRLYQGVADQTRDVLEANLGALEDVDELVVAGHSLGGAIGCLLVMDLLQSQPAFLAQAEERGLKLKLVTFGSPRLGNVGLKELYNHLVVEYRRRRGDSAFEEHVVRGYNDGVPCLPPLILGYRHLSSTPLYLYHGFLYELPAGFEEYSEFTVEAEEDAPPPDYPLGGHNYYNNRDMAKAFRQLQIAHTLAQGDDDWETRYLDRLAKERRWQER